MRQFPLQQLIVCNLLILMTARRIHSLVLESLGCLVHRIDQDRRCTHKALHHFFSSTQLQQMYQDRRKKQYQLFRQLEGRSAL